MAHNEVEDDVWVRIGAKFRDLVETSIQGIILFQDGHFIFANPSMSKITGYSVDQLIAMSPQEVVNLVHPDDQEQVRANIRSRLDGLPVKPNYVHRLIRADGEIRTVEIYASLTTHQDRPAIQAAYLDITEQKEIEKALRINEARLRLVTDNMLDMVLHTDEKGIVQYVSPSVQRIWELKPEEIMGTHLSKWLEVMHPDDRKLIGQTFANRLATGEGPTMGVYRFQHPSGEMRWNEYTVAAVNQEDGTLAGFTYVIRDINQRMQAALALQESEGRLRQAMNVGRLGIWEWDIATDLTIWMGDMFRMYGISPEAFTGRGGDYLNFTLPEDQKLQQDNIAQAFEQGITEKALINNERKIPDKPNQFRILRQDGTICYVQGDAIAIVDEAGNPQRMIGVLQDVTEIQTTIAALHQSEERYRLVSELTSDYAYAIRVNRDDSLVLEWMTEAFSRITGYSLEKFSLNLGADIVHPDDLLRHQQIMQKVFAGQPGQADLRIITADGSVRWIRSRNLPLWNDDEQRITHIYGAAQDITEQRAVEEAMQQAQKLESLGVLAGSVAHDFNNLLTAILTNASLINLRLGADDPLKRSLETIIDTTERAADITHQLLAYSGKGRFEVTQIDLNAFVQNNMKLLQATLPKNITLSFEPQFDLPLTEGDAGQIQQVIMNLIINAADAYSGQNGLVKLETSIHHIAPAEVGEWESVGFVVEAGDYICLAVEDDGHGMDGATLARIFDPFFTTKETGRGLGLAAVQGIIRSHRGVMRVHSEANKGTNFEILLPISQGKSKPDPITSTAITNSDNYLILIVDDEEAIREAACDILTIHGYQVLHVENGAKAISLCQEYHNEISLILLDMTMPVLSGMDTLQILQEEQLNIPVVLMSGYEEHEIDSDGQPTNVVGFLKKPFRIEKLVNTINIALNSLSHYRPINNA